MAEFKVTVSVSKFVRPIVHVLGFLNRCRILPYRGASYLAKRVVNLGFRVNGKRLRMPPKSA